MSKILIAGATGTIGRPLIASLQSRGMDVVAMTSRPGETIPGVATVYGDFMRQETLAAALQGVDTLFLLLPLTPEMATMGRNAIAAAKAAGVRHVVRSSGAGADADSPFSIARVHGEIDRHLQESGVAWTLLRPNSFMQNFLTYHLEQIRQGAYYAPHGSGATALIDVADIAECAATVLSNPTAHADRIYTLTGGEALDDDTQVAAISTATGRTIQYVDVPELAASDTLLGMGYPPMIVEWLMSLNAFIKAGYAAEISSDVEQLTGRPPRRFSDFVNTNAARWQVA